MVSKQQQLEWLANKYKTWPEQGSPYLGLSAVELGKFAIVNSHTITRTEWQQERDKMSSKPEVDNLWYERGELPPVGCECSAMRDGNWVKVEVLRHRVNNVDMNVAAVMNCDSFNVFWATDFRPLRTEREKAIEDMSRVMHEHDSIIDDDTLGALYDAGYRKVAP